jgi:RHS repeat-associated protein
VAQGLYDAFGRIPSGLPAGFGVGGEFQFTGEAVDIGTGFYYLRARYYDPQFGVFLSVDPYPGSDLQPLSENRYAYTRNNPLQLTDRTGFNPNRPIFCQDGCILFSPNTPADCPLPAFPGDPGLTTLR